MPSSLELKTHQLINKQRRQKGLPPIRWSPKMYRLAKDQSRKMASAGRLFHSGHFALHGGENVCGGKGNHSPRSFVESWLRSPEHRGWLLDRRVGTAAVGISSSQHGTYAAWSFSTRLEADTFTKKIRETHRTRRSQWGFALKVLAIFGGVLSLHGLYTYAHRNDWWIAGGVVTGQIKQGDLFFKVPMPPILDGIVKWMSYEGSQSWFIPIVILIGCIFLWVYSRKLKRIRYA